MQGLISEKIFSSSYNDLVSLSVWYFTPSMYQIRRSKSLDKWMFRFERFFILFYIILNCFCFFQVLKSLRLFQLYNDRITYVPLNLFQETLSYEMERITTTKIFFLWCNNQMIKATFFKEAIIMKSQCSFNLFWSDPNSHSQTPLRC